MWGRRHRGVREAGQTDQQDAKPTNHGHRQQTLRHKGVSREIYTLPSTMSPASVVPRRSLWNQQRHSKMRRSLLYDPI